MEKQYRNIGFLFLLLIPLTIWGFYKSYIIQSPEINVNIDGYIHVHAAIASVWIGLLIAQPLLIRYKKIRIHRLLGKASYLIFPLLILSFLPLIIRNYNGIVSVLNPLFDVTLLLIFYPLAIRNKKNVAVHMRFMIAATLIFIGPTLARILFHWTAISPLWGVVATWGSITLIVLGLLLWDRSRQRPYWPYVIALIGFFAYFVALLIRSYLITVS